LPVVAGPAFSPAPCTVSTVVPVAVQVRVTPLTTKRVEHSGIKVQLIGQIELASERGTPHDFVSLGRWKATAAAVGCRQDCTLAFLG
jgi:hypothetical protein